MFDSTMTVGGSQVSTLSVVFAGISALLGLHLMMQRGENKVIVGASILLGNFIAAYGLNCSIRGGCGTYAAAMFVVQLVYTFMLYRQVMEI